MSALAERHPLWRTLRGRGHALPPTSMHDLDRPEAELVCLLALRQSSRALTVEPLRALFGAGPRTTPWVLHELGEHGLVRCTVRSVPRGMDLFYELTGDGHRAADRAERALDADARARGLSRTPRALYETDEPQPVVNPPLTLRQQTAIFELDRAPGMRLMTTALRRALGAGKLRDVIDPLIGRGLVEGRKVNGAWQLGQQGMETAWQFAQLPAPRRLAT